MLLTTLPVRPLRTFRTSPFDRTFAQLANLALATGTSHRPATPATTATWNDGAYVLTVDLPGVPEDALSVSITGRTLALDVVTDDLTWNERIRLPHTLDVDATTAGYANGRLTVTMPASPEAQPRKVEISVGTAALAEVSGGTDQSGDSATNDTE
jgi:HSP20 family protein